MSRPAVSYHEEKLITVTIPKERVVTKSGDIIMPLATAKSLWYELGDMLRNLGEIE